MIGQNSTPLLLFTSHSVVCNRTKGSGGGVPVRCQASPQNRLDKQDRSIPMKRTTCGRCLRSESGQQKPHTVAMTRRVCPTRRRLTLPFGVENSSTLGSECRTRMQVCVCVCVCVCEREQDNPAGTTLITYHEPSKLKQADGWTSEKVNECVRACVCTCVCACVCVCVCV